jgi:hypothetical protein
MPRWKKLVALAALLATAPWQGVGDEPSTDRAPVAIEVWCVRATTRNKDISPELKSFATMLQERFKYTGFKLENKLSTRAEIDKTVTTPLLGGYKALLTPKGREQEKDVQRISLQLQVIKEREKKPRMDIKFKLQAEKFQPFGAWDLDGGDVLLILVSAK